MSNALSYMELTSALWRLGYREDAAAFHGALCGALCRQKPDEVDPFALLDNGEMERKPEEFEELRRLRDRAVGALGDLQAGFALMLPEDTVGLAQRAHALGAWCQGFLYGLTGRVKLELEKCSEEVQEIVKDFTQFTRAALDAGDDLEVEEGAYAELVEYIRVGAQLVYMELHPRPPTSGKMSKTVH
jgi:uncharacterized protein YgfB (UPF0149 family)